MSERLNGIAEIDWPALEHAYGAGVQVPRWLTDLLDPVAWEEALGELDAAIYHQGGAVYPAGAAAVPFLIRFACDASVPGRPDLLELLARFAALHNEMQEPWRSNPPARQCRTAFFAAFNDLVRLLDDPNPAVRGATVEILVELQERADDIAAELMRRCPDESVRAVAADYVLALGTLGTAGALSAGQHSTVAAWLSAFTPPPGDPNRLTFLVAARRLNPDAVAVPQLLAAYANAEPERGVGWLGSEIGADRTGRIALAHAGLDQAMRTDVDRPLAEVGAVMAKWRSATTELIADIAAALDGPPQIRAGLLHLLAAGGDLGRPFADSVAATLDEPGRTAAMAAWALARWGDPRAIPTIERSLRRNPEIYMMGSSHYTDAFYWLTQDPGIADVCRPLAAYADRLVPAIRWRLGHDSASPTAYQLTEVLRGYGPAALEAMPQLLALLDTQRRAQASAVLGGLGPAAREASAKLASLARSGGTDGTTAAWALFRITGDPEPFLACTDVLESTHYFWPTARHLGDLGPAGARYLPQVERQLTDRQGYGPAWEGVELGFAHFRITGDPGLCLDVFDAALDPLRHGRQLPVTRQALRHIVALGPSAARFAADLRRAVDQDERLVYSGGWRGIAEDDEARDLAIAALAAITA